MRIVLVIGAVIVLLALFAKFPIDAPVFVSGEVSAFEVKTSRLANWQLSQAQLTELRQWLLERKSGWSVAGKMPPTTVIRLTDIEGHSIQMRMSSGAVQIDLKVKEFSERDIASLRNILGVTIDG